MRIGSSGSASGQQEDEMRRLPPFSLLGIACITLSRLKLTDRTKRDYQNQMETNLLYESSKRDECIRQMETLHLQNAFSFGRYTGLTIAKDAPSHFVLFVLWWRPKRVAGAAQKACS